MARDRLPFSYRALQAWARTAVHVVYRHTEVTGASNVPTDRPAILAANHGNALGDIAVIVAKMPRFPHFLAAATWWKSAPARVLFRLGGVVPIHRRRDGTDTSQNASTFEACYAALAAGAHIAIFPEGEMHNEPALMPLKTGAARIALGAAGEAGVRGVAIVPVGMVYEDRGRFRSDVEIRFGDPIEIDDWVDRARAHPEKAAREVTDLLADRLTDVTVNHGSPTEAELLDRAAALVTSEANDMRSRSYSSRNELRRALASAVSLAAGESGPAYLELTAAIEAHDRDLVELGITHARHAPPLSEPPGEDRSRLNRELALLGPPAALGLVANAPVVLGAALASRAATHESWKATTKGLAGTFLGPIVWTIEYTSLARRIGRKRALALTAGGAVGGLAALAWRDRFLRRREISWIDRVGRDQPATLAAARASRELVRERVVALTNRV
jgi:1-acyl-sn-glycerol-3-phosphate acyltransferase